MVSRAAGDRFSVGEYREHIRPFRGIPIGRRIAIWRGALAGRPPERPGDDAAARAWAEAVRSPGYGQWFTGMIVMGLVICTTFTFTRSNPWWGVAALYYVVAAAIWLPLRIAAGRLLVLLPRKR